MSGVTRGGRGLAEHFRRHVVEHALLHPGEKVVVAVSGGLDSVALLHLLRFGAPVNDLRLIVAHLDHSMREDSPRDAQWVRGLARAWSIPVRLDALLARPRGEAQARELRYSFLQRVLREETATLIVTAHHADDQAETVLFRTLRGTGPRGLGGIAERSQDGLVRPLLVFWRKELRAYAESVGLRWLEDPTNWDLRFARNAIRLGLIPQAEAGIAPGARRALVRLARVMTEDEAGVATLIDGVLSRVVEASDPRRVALDREALLTYHPAVRARVLRRLAEGLGAHLDEAATRSVVEFASVGLSGRAIELPSSVSLRRDFDRLLLAVPETEVNADAETLEIANMGPAEARVAVGRRSLQVRWAPTGPAGGKGPLPSGSRSSAIDAPSYESTRPGDPESAPARWRERFSVSQVAFPLVLRGWLPGDRVRLSYGTKKLKKLFAESGVPALERPRHPVRVDGAGEVLWIPGVARSASAVEERGATLLSVDIAYAFDD